MTGGFVTGGWEFVWSAYGITFGVLAAYGTSVFLRLKSERNRTTAAQSARNAPEAE